MNRRRFIQTGALAGVGSLALEQIACGKSIANEIAIIVSTAGELKPLLPAQAALLDTIAKVARDFNVAYQRGDFNSAQQLFNTLAEDITTLMTDIGQDSPHITLLVAIISVAVHAVAALLNSQATPALAARVRGTTASRVTRMASKQTASKILDSVKF